MQLIIKGLKGDQVSVEVPEASSVLDLKAVIMSQQGHAASHQKLLYKGKILEDDKFLHEYSVKPGETIVIMVTKPAEPSLFEQNTQVLLDMGVSRRIAEELLKRCGNDIEKAKKVLIETLNEEDEDLDEEDNEESQNIALQATGTFGFLLNSEEFLKIRDILRSNPNEFEPMMTQMAITNPELYQLIKNNTEEFLSVVGLRIASRPNIEISQQEQGDIRELCELGFEEEDAIEAYISCDKNKDLAASYLFENYQQKFD